MKTENGIALLMKNMLDTSDTMITVIAGGRETTCAALFIKGKMSGENAIGFPD